MYPIQKIANYQIDRDNSIIDYLYYNRRSYWWAINYEIHIQLTKYNQNNKVSASHSLLTQIKDIVIFTPINDIIQFCFARIFSLMYIKKRHIHNSETPTIFFRQSLDRDWEEKIDANNNKYVENIYHHSVVKNLKNSVRIISPYIESIGFNLFRTSNKLKKVLKFDADNVDISLYYNYWSSEVWSCTHKTRLHFKKIWKSLKTKTEFFNFISETYNVPPSIVYNILHKNIVNSIPKFAKLTKLMENLVQKEHVSLLHMPDECSYGRTFTFVGKKLRIPTIAIQHGLIFNNTAYFSHSREDISRIKSDVDTSIPLVDITCVWGEGEQELLYKEGYYPNGSVIVTGNPRYDDYLNNSHKHYSREIVCKRFKIDSKQKIILWTTQCHGFSLDENKRYFKEVFSTIKSLDNTVLIIKQHPDEGDEYTILIQQYIAEYQLGNRVIVPNKRTDSTELVYISDVIINKNSTTGQEAVVFHKPQIILDFTNNPDLGEYVKEGVADASFEEGKLKQVLIKIFKNGFHKEENQEIYIQKHMNKLDGYATKRVVDVILKQLRINDTHIKK